MCFVSCGSSTSSSDGGGTSTTPASAETNVVTEATVETTIQATQAATINGFTTVVAGLQTIGKDIYAKDTATQSFTYTYNCPLGGTALASGTFQATCEGEPNWTCDPISVTMQIEFDECEVSVTLDDVEYEEVVGGTISSTASAQASGDETGLQSLSFSGTLSGTSTVAGDIDGTADLSNISYTGSGATSSDVTCSGTASVTSDSTTQTCTVSEDCTTCE